MLNIHCACTQISFNTLITISSVFIFSTIFWTEPQNETGNNAIYMLTNDNEAQQLSLPILRRKRSVGTPCNCSAVRLGPVMTTDQSQNEDLAILAYDSQSKSIIATDATSCHCKVVVSQSEGRSCDCLGMHKGFRNVALLIST